MTKPETYEEGRKAHNNGLAFSENPYPDGSFDAWNWAGGWMYEDDKDMGEQHQ